MKTDLLNEKGRELKSCFPELKQLKSETLQELQRRILSGAFKPAEAVLWLGEHGLKVTETLVRIYALDALKKAKESITLYEKRLNATESMTAEEVRREQDDIALFQKSMGKRQWEFQAVLNDRQKQLETAKERLLEFNAIEARLCSGGRVESSATGLPAYIQNLRDNGLPVCEEKGKYGSLVYFLEDGWQDGDYSKASNVAKIKADFLNGLPVTAEHVKKRHGITQKAFNSIIQNLRKQDWPISTERKGNGIGRYLLPEGWRPPTESTAARRKKAPANG